MLEIGGERYHNAASAARYLGITRFMFYYNVKAKVQFYQFGFSRRKFYRQSDLAPFREVLPIAS